MTFSEGFFRASDLVVWVYMVVVDDRVFVAFAEEEDDVAFSGKGDGFGDGALATADGRSGMRKRFSPSVTGHGWPNRGFPVP
jgi:hypothetical protein